MRSALILAGLIASAGTLGTVAAAAPTAPLRILIVSGGGYHDYPQQREILEQGLESRLNVEVSHIFYDPKPDDQKARPAIPIFTNPDYGSGYDLIIHDECAADESEPAALSAVLAPHQAGTPAVNLHCAMHSYRSGDWKRPVQTGADNARWFAFTGVQSSGHGPQFPIHLSLAPHPIAVGLKPWVTEKEELYNNLTPFGVTPVMFGIQPDAPHRNENSRPVMVGWTHLYGPKQVRVFSLTLAHNEATMADSRYLDLVARGVAWATGHLKADGAYDRRIVR